MNGNIKIFQRKRAAELLQGISRGEPEGHNKAAVCRLDPKANQWECEKDYCREGPAKNTGKINQIIGHGIIA